MTAPRIAIVGGGIAGLTAAWQFQRLGVPCTLFEASGRLGGIVETVRRDGFVVETGPDGWVTEKPWARELAEELGLGGELIHSRDATRVTYIVQGGRLVALPDGLRMMVPTDLRALEGSPLFSQAARRAYAAEPGRADELRAAAPAQDESIASFVLRHFGTEVLEKVGAPLLSGVFGGDVRTLSVRAVMPRFVELERHHGSLIAALQASVGKTAPKPIFTSLRGGVQTLVDRMAEELPAGSVELETRVVRAEALGERWLLHAERPASPAGGPHDVDGAQRLVFDHIILATPPESTARMLGLERLTPMLRIDASSCVIAALGFARPLRLPPGFGFLVPAGEGSTLMAATFVEGKYPDRVPADGHLLRGFFGGEPARRLAGASDDEVVRETHRELARLLAPSLGSLPEPLFAEVRHWPRSLPQYAVGHGERMAALRAELQRYPGLHLLGNAYHGVGLPDLVRDARALAVWLARHGQDGAA